MRGKPTSDEKHDRLQNLTPKKLAITSNKGGVQRTTRQQRYLKGYTEIKLSQGEKGMDHLLHSSQHPPTEAYDARCTPASVGWQHIQTLSTVQVSVAWWIHTLPHDVFGCEAASLFSHKVRQLMYQHVLFQILLFLNTSPSYTFPDAISFWLSSQRAPKAPAFLSKKHSTVATIDNKSWWKVLNPSHTLPTWES